VFGQQEAVFHDVEMADDMVVVARFYLRRRVNQSNVEGIRTDTSIAAEPSNLLDEEALVAWAFVPLVQLSGRSKLALSEVGVQALQPFLCSTVNEDPQSIKIDVGTKVVDLFEPPVPDIHHIPTQPQFKARDWRPYGKATLRIHVFTGAPRPGSLTPSEASEDEEEQVSKVIKINGLVIQISNAQQSPPTGCMDPTRAREATNSALQVFRRI
jgi:hypothetical protein